MNFLGIDIGGTFIKYAIINNENLIIKKWKKETKKFNTSEKFYDYICDDLDVLNIKGVGVSSPGIISEESCVLSQAADNVRVMYQSYINKEISKRIGRPVTSINDGKAAGYCELKMGNGVNSKSSAYLIIGTGIGGCICNENSIIEGINNIAGEFSHLPIITKYGIKGMGSLISMTALINMYNELANEDRKVKYGVEVCDRYIDDEELSKKVINKWCENIAIAIYEIIIFYNPEIICIGGGISEEDWFINKVKYKFYNEIRIKFKKLITTRIDRCNFNNDANLIGAVLYFKSKLYCN
ncbi:putative ROK family protein [Clostridium botulinum]|uniref:ROK family protein n=1 Tax=Clostridium botulinum TaxID=1491 RepID=UPI00058229A2|nr:ROK family protein [Clostridium botulinum]NFI82822.1 ROK family protein [Clostridium botulinum]BAQ12321.1 putative ROK family protein [Clostridium botulinum]